MEAIDELVQLSDSMRQAAALLADEDVDESASSSKRPSTFLNVVALGNVVSGIFVGFGFVMWVWLDLFGSGGFVSGFWIWRYGIEGESLDVLGSVEMVDGCVDLGWGHLKLWEFELVEKCWGIGIEFADSVLWEYAFGVLTDSLLFRFS